MGRKRKNKNTKTIGTDFLGGIFVVLGIMLFVFLTFNNIGVIATIINSIFKGLFSNVIFVLPLVFIFVGIYLIISDKLIKAVNEIGKGIILMVFLSSLVYAFTETNFGIFDNFVRFTVDSYNGGIQGLNMSGVVGAIIASLVVKLIGVIATRILFVFITLVTVLYVFNISFKQLIYFIYNIFVFIANFIYDVFVTITGKNEENVKYNTNFDTEKMSRSDRKKALLAKMELDEKMKEKGSKNVEKNLKENLLDQIEFDFNKLGGKPSESELRAKEQRDDFFKQQKEQKEDKSVKEVLTLDHAKHEEEQNYVFPPITLLNENKNADNGVDKKAIQNTAIKLQKTLSSFGVDAKVTHITKGPTVTRYELTPNIGVKVSKIVNLSDDIALNLAAKSIRIEAPIPGKAAVGIEVPNQSAESVFLREVIESDVFKKSESKVAFSLGKDAAGEIKIGDIAKMPHVLIAGSTGSGKSVCINSLIVSMLYKSKPSEVKLILIDPKMVELSGYNGIPHLLIPVVTDPKKAAGALNWAVQEMVNRYNLFASHGVKDIKGYNKVIENEVDGAKLPQIVIIIDELADLMMVAPNDVEDAICRLAQMARAAGMHLVVATQRPSVDVITGIIKANIPSRIAFTVSSQVDSRTILDMAGAEKLLGKGDMLYFPVGENKPLRIQGAFISEKEIESIVESIKQNCKSTYNDDIIESIEKSALKGSKSSNCDNEDESEDADEILNQAIDMVVDMGQASASMLQRRFKIGYSRAGRIIDQMEARGLISGYDGSKPRQVLISKSEWEELKFSQNTCNSDSNN
ncbi:MAG: DNA translocase FtsK [Clostridia bacterium]|nr:DNA translocase FtsK [Clostridia bacterium]